MNTIARGLSQYYKQQYPDRENLVISEVKEITMGWETELYSFDVDFKAGERMVKEERVVRLYPGNFAVDKATKEFKVMSRLFHAGYPVPEVFNFETDENILGKPFIIMERIKGHNLDDEFQGVSDEEREHLLGLFVRLFVDLHNLDVTKVFPDNKIRRTADYIDGVLERYRRNIEEKGIRWLIPVLEWLDEHKASVTPEKISILHRDFHPLNIMIWEDGSQAVLDWGAVTVGDYRDDLAWTMLLCSTFGDPAWRDIILESYRTVSGREVHDIEFFEVMAIIRRLTDVYISLTSGAEEMGMRPEAVEMMKEASGHIKRVYNLLRERTGLRLPEFEELLITLE